jgi:hypothetical protein
VGVPGPTQKLIARCVDEAGEPVAYVKVGFTEMAKGNIAREYQVLEALATHSNEPLGPNVLWHGAVGDGAAIAGSAVQGDMLVSALPPLAPAGLRSVCGHEFSMVRKWVKNLSVNENNSYPIVEHPAINRLKAEIEVRELNLPNGRRITEEIFTGLLVPLQGALWPVVAQHGDLTPWNMIRETANGTSKLCAIDWEEGSATGMPHFDLIYYIMQTGFLIHGCTPADVARCVLDVLMEEGLDAAEAKGFMGLGALDAYVRFSSRTGRKAEALNASRMKLVQLAMGLE